MPTRRDGFTLVEVLIVLTVVAILAAAVMPRIVDTVFSGQAAALARNLDSLADAAAQYRGDIGRYPSELVHLTTKPGAGTTDLCGRQVNVDWDAWWQGPYIQRHISASGLTTGTATIANDLRRDPATIAGGRFAMMLIDATDVDRSMAEEVEASFDANADFSAGTIRWVDDGGGRGTLSFAIPIRGC